MKLPVSALAGHSCQATLRGVSRWPMPILVFATSTSTVSNLRRRRDFRMRRSFRSSRQQGGDATGGEGDGQNDETRGFHTLNSLPAAATAAHTTWRPVPPLAPDFTS